MFTYELLSALRGAADVNRDRRIEYSEVFAFMAAANREVSDARAHLSIVAKPPDINRRARLVQLSDFPRAGFAWLANVPGGPNIIDVSDARGRRLASLHGDGGSSMDLLAPAGSMLYVRSGLDEACFVAADGEIVPFQSLKFAAGAQRERGALDDALRRGLFAAPYGRSYYEGVVDQNPELIAVDFGSGPGVSRYWATPSGAVNVCSSWEQDSRVRSPTSRPSRTA